MTGNNDKGNKAPKLYTQSELDIKLFKTLTKLGISANLKGFRYLNSAISAVYYDPQAGSHVVSGLYNRLALENHTTPECIERSMRTALHRVQRTDNRDNFFSFFGEDAGLTTKKFINSIAKKLREESDEEKDNKNRTAK